MRRDRVRPAPFPVAEGATTTYTVRIDKSYPTLAPAVTPDPVLLRGRVAVAPHATDAVSGIASSACGRVSSATVGRHTVTCTATDSAGNATSADVDYTVLYRARFLAPTVAPLLVNSLKPRHDTLLRFRLTDAARVPVSSTAAVTAVTAKATSCTRFDTDPTGGTSVLNRSLRYSSRAGGYELSWRAPISGARR